MVLLISLFFSNSADKDAQKGKKSARKTTKAGGSGIDLQKIAQEQQTKLEKKREERKEQIKVAKEAPAPAPSPESPKVPKPKAQKDPEPSKSWESRLDHQIILVINFPSLI